MPKMFQLPAPITFADPSTKEPLTSKGAVCSFKRCFVESFLAVPIWQGHRALRAANKIEDALEAAEKADGVVVLDQEHYELLKKAAEHDDALNGFVPPLRRQLLPFIDAVLEAMDYVAPAVRKAE